MTTKYCYIESELLTRKDNLEEILNSMNHLSTMGWELLNFYPDIPAAMMSLEMNEVSSLDAAKARHPSNRGG